MRQYSACDVRDQIAQAPQQQQQSCLTSLIICRHRPHYAQHLCYFDVTWAHSQHVILHRCPDHHTRTTAGYLPLASRMASMMLMIHLILISLKWRKQGDDEWFNKTATLSCYVKTSFESTSNSHVCILLRFCRSDTVDCRNFLGFGPWESISTPWWYWLYWKHIATTIFFTTMLLTE
jgi:hypothetical protein